MRKRLLYIAHRVPFPPDKGERVRAFNEIRALSAHFRITLAALAHNPSDTRAVEGLRPWCERILTARAGGRMGLLRAGLFVASGRSATEGFFSSRRLRQAIQEESEPFDVVFAYCSSVAPYALAVQAKARVTDLVDVDSAKWASYADTTWWPKRWLYRREAQAVAALEQRAIGQCDAVVLVSQAETQALGVENGKISGIANGVDTDYFSPRATGPSGPPSLVFTGTMDYRPNVEGVCWFVREVWPTLKRDLPDLTFSIVGRDPAPAVQRLAEVPGIAVTGSVPDVRPYLGRSTLAVVPLLTARGIQNKVLEAMAMAKAVVGSSGALEGLEIGLDTEVVQADTPDQWSRTIRGLLADKNRRQVIENAARTRVVTSYTWEARLAPLVSMCLELAHSKVESSPRE